MAFTFKVPAYSSIPPHSLGNLSSEEPASIPTFNWQMKELLHPENQPYVQLSLKSLKRLLTKAKGLLLHETFYTTASNFGNIQFPHFPSWQ